MSRRWLEKEGHQWVTEGIIDEHQFRQILSKYEKGRKGNALPFFASLLIGLGILSFVASNWPEIPHLVRLLLILIVLTGFHLFGFRQYEKGKKRWGESLIGLGILTFGAGIFLTGQMFHFTAHDAGAFVLWSLAAIGTAIVLRGHYLYYLALILPVVGEIYSMIMFDSFNLWLTALFIGGGGFLTYRRRKKGDGLFFALNATILAIIFIFQYDISYMWIVPFAMFMYITGYYTTGELRWSFHYASFSIILMLSLIHVVTLQWGSDRPGVTFYTLIMSLLFLAAGLHAIKYKNMDHLPFFLLFLPWFWLGEVAAYVYLILLFFIAIYLLNQGYRLNKHRYVLQGTILFLLSTFVGYKLHGRL